MKILIINTLLLSSLLGLSACSFVSLNPGAENIAVSADSNSLSNCKFLGNTDVSLWSKADTFQSQGTVEDQFNTLARNQAATMNGNTVIAKSGINNGQKTYAVYNCPAAKVESGV